MIGMVLQARIIHPRHLVVTLKVSRNLSRAVADSIHSQRQRLDTLQNQKGIEWRYGCSGIAQRHYTSAADIGRRPQRFGIDHSVIAHVRLIEPPKTPLVIRPRKFTRVDDGTTDARPMTAEILGQRVHHDVGAMLERSA